MPAERTHRPEAVADRVHRDRRGDGRSRGALPVLPVTTPPSSALVTDQSYAVPAGRIFTLRRARVRPRPRDVPVRRLRRCPAGSGLPQILDFYYPGTSWAEPDRQLRVLITADTPCDLVVQPGSGLRVHRPRPGTSYPLPDAGGATRWRIIRRRGTYRRRTSPERGTAGARAAVPPSPGTVSSRRRSRSRCGAHGRRAYPGALRAASPSRAHGPRHRQRPVDGRLRAGRGPAEMPASWQPEAVQAQAVAARTYAAWSRDSAPRGTGTSATPSPARCTAAKPRGSGRQRGGPATAGQILTYGGTAAFTQFSSSSGGWPTAGSRPVPRRQGRPVRRARGQPGPRLDRGCPRRPDPGRLPGTSAG